MYGFVIEGSYNLKSIKTDILGTIEGDSLYQYQFIKPMIPYLCQLAGTYQNPVTGGCDSQAFVESTETHLFPTPIEKLDSVSTTLLVSNIIWRGSRNLAALRFLLSSWMLGNTGNVNLAQTFVYTKAPIICRLFRKTFNETTGQCGGEVDKWDISPVANGVLDKALQAQSTVWKIPFTKRKDILVNGMLRLEDFPMARVKARGWRLIYEPNSGTFTHALEASI